MAASDILFGRGILPTEIAAWQQRLETSGESRIEIVSAIINDRVKSKALSKKRKAQPVTTLTFALYGAPHADA